MGARTDEFRGTLVVFALFALPSVMLGIGRFGSEPDKYVALPLLPFVPVALLLWVFVNTQMNGVLAFAIGFITVAVYCGALGIAHARRPICAKIVALITGVANAALIPTLIRYLA